MKKLLLFINFLLITNLLFSQHSIFTIFSDEGEKFYLYVDGKKINNNPESQIANVKVYNDYVNLRVEFVNKSIPTVKKDFAVKDMNGNYTKSTLIIKKNNKGQYKIKENSFEVYYPEEYEDVESYKNNTSTSSSVKNNSNENVSMSMNVKSSDKDNASVSLEITAKEESSSENIEVSMSISSSSVTTESSSYYSETSYSESSSSSNFEDNSSNDVDPCLVSNEEFKRMKNNIQSKNFDDSKLTTAKDIVKSKCLKSVQIRDLMKLLSFEDDRLALAIYSYKYVNDKENYYEVYNAFNNEFTIDELKEAIGN